jgi:hypothetical protein
VADSGATVTGVDVCARAYAAVAEDAKNELDAHRRIASAAESAARGRAPVRTGALAGSIAGKASEHDAELAVAMPYWPAQEFGTRYLTGRRYMAAGIDAGRAAAPGAYTDRLAAVIKAHT